MLRRLLHSELEIIRTEGTAIFEARIQAFTWSDQRKQ